MKRTFGISVLSAMLILGQPIMTYADTTGSTILKFEDIKSIITEHNLEVRINQNNRLDSNVGLSDLKRDIKDMKDRIEYIDSKRDRLDGNPDEKVISLRAALGAEKRLLLDSIKTLERKLEDMPTSVSSTDIRASMSDDAQIRLAEGAFIEHNVLMLTSSDLSTDITTTQNQLATLRLKKELGLATSTNVNELETKLNDLQTKLEGIDYQRELLERQLKDVLNDQDNTLQIRSVPLADEKFSISNKEDDLKKALENSYSIKLQEEQIVILKANLIRAEKDHGLSSDEYSRANYALSNANLALSQQRYKLNSDYYNIVDDIAKKQSNLRLEEQKLEDKKVALSEAQLKMSLGVITKLDLDTAVSDFQLQDNAVKTNQIELFSAINGYDWFLKGMPWTS